MIPWRLSFSGIRDYRPEQLDLSGESKHILITGPNGAGKSTVTYCMGAVLYSSKLDVEGLRSRNLLPEKTWSAQITLVFKNEGTMKIDAPKYIQFGVRLVQEPNEPIKKEYSIATGDELDNWETTQKYTSGDKQHNFTAYKRKLLHTYKIDPDAYYLIWYQQEVNQFAVMNPEERFRIFSEMHGIDKAQKEWEESIEKLKDTKETLRLSESRLDIKKLELSVCRGQLQRYEDNQKRLRSGAQAYIQALLQLERELKKEHEQLEGVIDDLTTEQEELYHDLIGREEQKTQISLQIEELTSLKERVSEQQVDLEQIVEKLQEEVLENKKSILSLEEELGELTKRKNQLNRTESEVYSQLGKVQENLNDIEVEIEELELNLINCKAVEEECLRKVVGLEQRIESDRKRREEYTTLLNHHSSSHHVKQQIEIKNAELLTLKEEYSTLSKALTQFEEERTLLVHNKNFSERQKESLSYFKKEGIKAYTLQELVELDEFAQIKDEQRFQAIKYSLFFEGKNCNPPNDLYHVPLMRVVPHRSINTLPHLHLKIKDDVPRNVYPQAMKVLWWIEQLFLGEATSIRNDYLYDSIGIRGPQEKERYLLSKKALESRRQFLNKEVDRITKELVKVQELIATYEKSIPEYISILSKIQHAEAFFTVEYELVQRENQLRNESERLKRLKKEFHELNKRGNNLQLTKSRLNDQEVILLDEKAFYEELGKMKDKYQALQSLNSQLNKLESQESQALQEFETVSKALHELESKVKKYKRKENAFEDDLIDAKRKKNQLDRQVGDKEEELEELSKQIIECIKEVTDMENLVPDLFKEFSQFNEVDKKASLPALRQQRESGKTTFDVARNEPDIDPSAPANFEAVQSEFDRLTDEFNRTSSLVEQDQERMEKLQDNLETTINMRVVEIQTKFQYYMSQFQFEGRVEWTSTEKKGRTLFSLFIKVRKEGHRGTMDDVSKKARGGRVGKGVSGGEESLSSLLFALALLQNLSFKPGFIVLDEFDSALDESRKLKVFDLYVQELNRKLIILTPKSHEESYLHRFSKALIVQHDPSIPASKIVGIKRREQ